ncbi:MAG: hypothetical protein AAFQ82_18250 [Myxococcota bacterium]
MKRQILDLRGMAETGMLEDDARYFGVDTPEGRRWYNVEPIGWPMLVDFVECGQSYE